VRAGSSYFTKPFSIIFNRRRAGRHGSWDSNPGGDPRLTFRRALAEDLPRSKAATHLALLRGPDQPDSPYDDLTASRFSGATAIYVSSAIRPGELGRDRAAMSEDLGPPSR